MFVKTGDEELHVDLYEGDVTAICVDVHNTNDKMIARFAVEHLFTDYLNDRANGSGKVDIDEDDKKSLLRWAAHLEAVALMIKTELSLHEGVKC